MVYCSLNTRSALAKDISAICGSPLTDDLGVYLGMPLIHSRVSAATYANLVDKVQSRLASWKNAIDLNAIVKDFWTDQSWNMDLLLSQLPVDVVNIINAIPIAISNTQDKMIWGGIANGVFSVKSAYLLSCVENGYQNNVWLKNWASAKPKLQVARLPRHMEMLSWIKPRSGTFKLNVDGSRNRIGGIGAGGVIRDHTGVWIGGFMVNIGAGEVLQAEAWGLFYGIQLALSLDIPNLEVESDSSILINLLQGTDIDLHPLGTIVLNCRTLLQQFDSIHVNHIHHERSTIANILAKNSTLNAHGICYFQEPPVIVIEALLDDIVGFASEQEF
ncbi:hypothetical protein ACLB2K_056319 [Fragaria x ananassa]